MFPETLTLTCGLPRACFFIRRKFSDREFQVLAVGNHLPIIEWGWCGTKVRYPEITCDSLLSAENSRRADKWECWFKKEKWDIILLYLYAWEIKIYLRFGDIFIWENVVRKKYINCDDSHWRISGKFEAFYSFGREIVTYGGELYLKATMS